MLCVHVCNGVCMPRSVAHTWRACSFSSSVSFVSCTLDGSACTARFRGGMSLLLCVLFVIVVAMLCAIRVVCTLSCLTVEPLARSCCASQGRGFVRVRFDCAAVCAVCSKCASCWLVCCGWLCCVLCVQWCTLSTLVLERCVLWRCALEGC